MDKKELHSYIAKNQENICGIAAMKNGEMRYSDYWHGFKPSDTVHVMSVTKSVVSVLIGIAIDKGLISGVGQRVLDFFPEYQVKRGEKTIQHVTIEHLLTMTAPYKYKYEPWTKVCAGDDWTKAALDLLGGKAGLTGAFKYSTLGIHILTGILAKASGRNTVDFANQYLFGPLDISPSHNFGVGSAKEHREFILSKEPKKHIWFADPLGVGAAGFGLCLSAGDMAKIGQLCLNQGVYNKTRVVSREWIAESTKPRIPCDEHFANMEYGYLWWRPDPGSLAYAALGDGGNVIYINPQCNTVVSVSATFRPAVFDRVEFIQSFIEPLLAGF